MQCKIILQDEVRCKIAGLHRDHADALWTRYAVEAPNFFFHPAYKLGRWDGKLRYFQKSGDTYIYLLEEILPKLKTFGYKPSIVDQRSELDIEIEPVKQEHYSHIIIPDLNEPLLLRDYQVEAANTLLEEDNGIVVAATSAGKSYIIGSMCDQLSKAGLKTIVIVPTKDLIQQTRDDIRFLGVDCGEYWSKTKDIEHKTVVSTWQALQRQAKLMSHFDVVIVDEVHLAKGPALQKLLVEHGSHIIKRYGLTGTMPKAMADGMTVKCTIGPVRYEVHAKELQDKGYLSHLHIKMLQFEEDLQEEYEQYCKEAEQYGDKKVTYIQFKDRYLPDYHAEKAFMQNNKHRMKTIADMIIKQRSLGKGNTFVLVNGVRFGKALSKLIPDSIFLYAKDNEKVRAEAYGKFADNDDAVVIATYNLASTGLNIKRIFNLFFIDPGKSYIRTIQSIGRGLRKAHDKNFVNVYEVFGDLKYAKKHATERVKYYKEHQYPYSREKMKL